MTSLKFVILLIIPVAVSSSCADVPDSIIAKNPVCLLFKEGSHLACSLAELLKLGNEDREFFDFEVIKKEFDPCLSDAANQVQKSMTLQDCGREANMRNRVDGARIFVECLHNNEFFFEYRYATRLF